MNGYTCFFVAEIARVEIVSTRKTSTVNEQFIRRDTLKWWEYKYRRHCPAFHLHDFVRGIKSWSILRFYSQKAIVAQEDVKFFKNIETCARSRISVWGRVEEKQREIIFLMRNIKFFKNFSSQRSLKRDYLKILAFWKVFIFFIKRFHQERIEIL